nr:uncharacterized protein LOC126529688 [Dermacentor andersoni]
MHRVLGLPNVAAVMDDILLWGKTKQEHDHNLQLLLTRCREQNLRLNLKKCFFLQREVRYLGHVLSAEGLRVDAHRVQDILEMPTPRNSSQRSLQDLLAATNDDDTLVKLRDYANTTWPLHKQEVPEPLRSYWAYRDEIHAQDGLVFRSNKVIREFRTTTASSLNTWCSQIFSVHGLPRKLCPDNGPPFNSSEFKDFLNTLTVNHITSSPYHPRSNGMTERAVQEAKKLLNKCSFKMPVFQMALLEWRNTPRDDVLQSPVQRLMGRQTRTLLPVPTSHLEPRTIPPYMVQGRLQEIRQRQRTYYNRGSRNLPPVMPGQQVTVYDTNQRTWSPAVFLRTADEHRSTIVKTEDGRELRRTREHLRLVDPHPEASLVPEDVSSTEPPQELRRSTRLRREPCRYPQQETRICVDLTKLNEVIERKRFIWPTVEQILGELGGARVFSKLEARSSLHQVKLSADSQELTTFITPFGRFPEVVSVGSTTAPAVIAAIKSCIASFGIPDIVRTDNGRQFVSNEFAEFSGSYGFRHETSSPRYLQSNGEAERMVRTVKDLLFKGPDPYLALLSYRDTPGPNGISPAQVLVIKEGFGRTY